ncbi:hypothetical protein GTA08_BOTSDO00187 [Neofusicoccum parvum]|uniref:Uncharacterized protein n=1 Tax=Neofusicoccum parvum TaxID=310453 RepID=A0ACB5SGD9_9PEZI|nr:hypothetical protein GTA08_BOTSDO00187 [Neofusicoccum parvum]
MPDDRTSHHHDTINGGDAGPTAASAATANNHPGPPPQPPPSSPSPRPPNNAGDPAANPASSTGKRPRDAPGPGAGPREFQRAYKACVPCRKRKARCEVAVPADGGVPGPPCTRCKRALRECVFTEERAWKKQRLMEEGERRAKRRAAADADASADGDAGPPPSPPTRVARRQDGAMQQGDGGLADSMIRTVVASGNDALNLLFEAATREAAAGASGAHQAYPSLEANGFVGVAAGEGQEPGAYATPGSNMSVSSGLLAPSPVQLSEADEELLDLWKNCRFVRMGWFTAREAVTYVDLFFQNLSPLSPILTEYYADHSRHYELVTKEPFLCCTILALSSRYHVLPGVGGASRGYFIHHRLWEHCQHLILRIMLGQEKSSTAKTRTVGSIEGLLLLSEWHPRALHFPPASDGWDAGLVAMDPDVCDEPTSPEGNPSASNRWLEDVIEPARRSDRMSWMLLGCGLSLAHELGIFEQDEGNKKGAPCEDRLEARRKAARNSRARKLLYVFVEQLASRIGCTSMIPQSLSHTVLGRSFAGEVFPGANHSEAFVSAWIELTKLVKSASDMLFPSASFTRQLLRTGRYIGLLEHFQPLLSQWRGRYLDSQRLGDVLQDMLAIEYQFVRIFVNSLGMQAVVERTLDEAEDFPPVPDPNSPNAPPIQPLSVDSTDYDFIQEVVDGSCEILRKVIKLAEANLLRFAPVRIYLHITTSAIYLIKGLSLGVWNTKLRASLDVLDRGIQALRSGTLDDMHLASRYATLLEVHVARLRRSFVVASRPPRLGTRPPSMERADAVTPGPPEHQPQHSQQFGAGEDLDIHALGASAASSDDWLALPFDPSMAPFGAGGSGIQKFPGLDDGMLSFLWNLPS